MCGHLNAQQRFSIILQHYSQYADAWDDERGMMILEHGGEPVTQLVELS